MEEDLGEVFEIQDPEIDVMQIMDKIREGIAKRRAEGPLEDVGFPSFGRHHPTETGSLEFSEQEMYYNLEQANLAYDKVWVSIHLVSRPLPLLGRLWLDIKRRAHELVVFYVNMLAGKQVAVNEHVVRTLNHLTHNLTSLAKREELRSLQDEVAKLETRVRELEALADRGKSHGSDRE